MSTSTDPNNPWFGLNRKPITTPAATPDETATDHRYWDHVQRVAAEMHKTDEPTPAQINAMIAMEKVCRQILRCRHDTAMVKRLMPLILKKDTSQALVHAAVFISFFDADRPTPTA